MSENGNGEFKWGGWTKPYDYLLAEARYGYGRKATDIVGYTWDADAHTPEETRKALKAGVLKATDPKARLDQHKIPESGVEDREGNEIHPVFASDPEAKEFFGEASGDMSRISQKIAQVVNELADDLHGGAGYDWDEVPRMQAYSGRGMYGKYCLGVSVGRYASTELLKAFKKNRIPDPSRDQLGMGHIYYWQNIPHDPVIHKNYLKDPYESVESADALTEDIGDSRMSGVNFVKEKTPPYQGLPDETILGCYRDGVKIAEIWQEREDNKNPKKITGFTVYPPWVSGGGATGQGKWSKSFKTAAEAKRFVIGMKTEEVESADALTEEMILPNKVFVVAGKPFVVRPFKFDPRLLPPGAPSIGYEIFSQWNTGLGGKVSWGTVLTLERSVVTRAILDSGRSLLLRKDPHEPVEFTENALQAAPTGQVTLKQGDIIVCEWGVTMSLVDFYKVVSVSGDWVNLVKLGSQSVSGDWAAGKMAPTSQVVGGNIRRKMKREKDYRGNERIIVTINPSAKQYGQVWDGRPVFYTTMD